MINAPFLLFLIKSPSHLPKVVRNLFMESRQVRRRSFNSSSSISSPYFTGNNDVTLRCDNSKDGCDSIADEIRDRTKRLKRCPGASGSNTTLSDSCSSPFASKTILQVIDDYSDHVIVKEVEKKQKHVKPAPNLDKLQKFDGHTVEIKDPMDIEHFVFFDLETGGLSPPKADILEIAAVSHDGRMFSTYVKPVKKINPLASKVNHIAYKKGNVMFKGKIVKSLPLKDAMNGLLEWLMKVGNGHKVVLVAHNSKFDSRFLIHYLVELGMENCFLEIVAGFIDTIPIFKKVHPGYTSYKQDILVSKFLTKDNDYDAHSALSDVKYLRKLFNQELLKPIVDFREFSYTSSHAIQKHLLGPMLALNVTSFKHLTKTKVISHSIATKLGALDYRYDELVATYKVKGQEGLKTIFTQPDSKGYPQITAHEITLSKVLAYFDKKYNCSK